MEFVDEAVDLVDEQNGLHLLLERLANNRFGLRHGAFNGACKNKTSVDGAHCTGYVATEVDVTGRIDEVDEEVRALNGVHHRGGRCVDGDTTSRFLLVKVQNTCCSSKFVGHHSGPCDEVVRKRGLAVVDVSGNAQVSDLGENVHDFGCLLDVVFFASHGYHRVLVFCPTEEGFLSASQAGCASVHELHVGGR